MAKQEKEDDADLKALKEKLKVLQDTQPSSDKKDDLIKNLTLRLQQGEQAIVAAEQVISHERANRKILFQNLKKSNQELRDLVEKEKRALSEKVQDELDKHLKQAIHEKMSSDEAMNKAKADLQAKVTAYDELTKQNQKMQEDLKLA